MPVHKILHVIPSVGPQRGGPSVLMRTLARALSQAGMEVHVATTDDNGPGRLQVTHGIPQQEDGATFWYFPRQTRFYTFSWPLTRWLARHVREFDLVHIHALFSYAALPAALLAHRAGVPYIVRPLGTLNRWGVANRRPWLKKVSFRVLESRILSGAAGIHYTSEQELLEAGELGVSGKPLIVPNAVELPVGQASRPLPLKRNVILFLSRIDRKKGIDLLLAAFARVRRQCPSASLVLAGSGDPQWIATLKNDAARLGIAADVTWAGFLTGQDKWTALTSASVFVLPSYSENFGIALVEALACGCPVVLSDQVGIHREISRAQAGLVTPCRVEELAQAILDVLTDAALRRRMSENGVRLAQQQFSLEAVGGQLAAAYATACAEAAL
ncbi:MAG TPA: glycosyltransferase [Bryobacteraceae bacterium]|nr:glycosyltransferase [Bryobacteraceae bacterium]